MIGANAPISQGGGGSSFGASESGMWISAFGALNSAIGSFYSAKAAQFQAKSSALNAEFESTISAINARGAEIEAQSILDEGQRSAGLAGLQFGAIRGTIRAEQAAGGFTRSGDIEASLDYSKQVDLSAIKSNATRAAVAARMRAVNFRAGAASAGLSAKNLRASARTINPWAAGAGSLVGEAGDVASRWAYYKDHR